jgi:uncharacterized protein YndB with AHSA1/START domain
VSAVAQPIEPITLKATTSGSPAAAWAALTDPMLVVEWFTEASPVGPVGSPYRLDFGDGSVISGRIQALEPGHRLAYSWAWADTEPVEETLVTWTIEPLPDGGTEVTLEHDGWAEAGSDETARNDHASYWEGYLEDLVAVLDDEA